jgi:hypothetical protein
MMSYTVQLPTDGLGLAKMKQKDIVGFDHSRGGTGEGRILYHFLAKTSLFPGPNFSTLRNGPFPYTG